MIIFLAQTPAGGDLRTLLATRTMLSVRTQVLATSHAPLQSSLLRWHLLGTYRLLKCSLWLFGCFIL